MAWVMLSCLISKSEDLSPGTRLPLESVTTTSTLVTETSTDSTTGGNALSGAGFSWVGGLGDGGACWACWPCGAGWACCEALGTGAAKAASATIAKRRLKGDPPDRQSAARPA